MRSVYVLCITANKINDLLSKEYYFQFDTESSKEDAIWSGFARPPQMFLNIPEFEYFILSTLERS